MTIIHGFAVQETKRREWAVRPRERRAFEQVAARARDALGAKAYARLHATGSHLTEEQEAIPLGIAE